MGMFKKKSKSDAASDSGSIGQQSYPAYNSASYDTPLSPRSSASAPTVNGTGSKKKGGLGSKLKGLVSHTRRRSFSDSKSLNSNSSSSYSQQDPPKLKRKVLLEQQQQQQQDESSYESYSSSEEQFHNQLGTVAEVNEDDYDSDGELRVKHHHQQQRIVQPSRSQRLGGSSPLVMDDLDTINSSSSSISVVILLVDPDSKRFELLEFHQKKPKKNLKVKTVLKKFQKSITEPLFVAQKFVGLMDRMGQIHKPNALLSQAMMPDIKKDILVGIVQGIDPNQLLQSVRPILGNPKMGRLLDMNGFDTKGWVKKKKTKDSILDKRPPPRILVQEEKQGGTLAILAFVLIIGSLLWGVDKLLVHLDHQGAFVQPLPDWPTVVEQASDVARQGVQAAKEAIIEGNSTAMVAMANSTYAAVEETALEAVSDTAAIVKELGLKFDIDFDFDVPTTTDPHLLLESAKDKFLMAAVPVAEVLSEAKTNLSSSIANVTDGILANATKAMKNHAAAKATTTTATPNSVWEDYVLIGLLLCWLLYWMAI